MPESFESQAMMLRRLAGACDTVPKQRFEQIAKTIDQLAALRKKCINAASNESGNDFGDELAAEIVALLRLPTKE